MGSVRLLSLTAVAAIALISAPGRSDEPKPTGDKKNSAAKLPTEAEIMAAKLKHAQGLIDAITREDFKKVDEHATALVRISTGAEFLNARKTEEYEFQARMFRRGCNRVSGVGQALNPA